LTLLLSLQARDGVLEQVDEESVVWVLLERLVQQVLEPLDGSCVALVAGLEQVVVSFGHVPTFGLDDISDLLEELLLELGSVFSMLHLIPASE
jgi:hypothetical protein